MTRKENATRAKYRRYLKATNHSPLLLPDAVDFADVFARCVPYDDRAKLPEPARLDPDPQYPHMPGPAIGRYLSVREPYQSWAVVPRPETVAAVKPNMLSIYGDSLSWEIVNHDNGFSLVIIRHSCIIGSRYVAYVRSASVPKADV